MNTSFDTSFERDLKKIKSKQLKQKIRQKILEVESVTTIASVTNYKHIKGYKPKIYYRIAIDDYRIGLRIVDDFVIFSRVLHRKDIYKFFPK